MLHYVTFLKHSDIEGDEIYAAFPVNWDMKGNLTCYAHVGQHSSVSKGYIEESDTCACGEYEDLLKELKDIYEDDDDILVVITKENFLEMCVLIPD